MGVEKLTVRVYTDLSLVSCSRSSARGIIHRTSTEHHRASFVQGNVDHRSARSRICITTYHADLSSRAIVANNAPPAGSRRSRVKSQGCLSDPKGDSPLGIISASRMPAPKMALALKLTGIGYGAYLDNHGQGTRVMSYRGRIH
jgi:hypothetical protein